MNPVVRSLVAVLVGLSVAVPLLNHYKLQPIPTFFSESFHVVLLALLALSAGFGLPRVIRVPRWQLFFPMLMIALIGAQILVGLYEYPAVPFLWMGGMILVMMIALLVAGAREKSELGALLLDRMGWAIVAVAVVNAIIQIIQAKGWAPAFAPFVFVHADQNLAVPEVCRAAGNVAQANHANTLAWLGVISAALLSSRSSKPIARVVAVPVIGLLVLSSAIAGSRMAWIDLALVALLILVLMPMTRRVRLVVTMSLVVAFLFASWAVVPWIYDGVDCTSSSTRWVSGEGNWVRLLLMRQAWEAWLSSPLLGIGAGHLSGWSYAFMPRAEGLATLDNYSHNLIFQVLAEFGVLGFVLLLFLAIFVLSRLGNTVRDGYGPMLIGWGLVILVHSALEYPLWYSYFLVPFAISVFWLARGERDVVLRISRNWIVVPAIVLLCATAWVVTDYQLMERARSYTRLADPIKEHLNPEAQSLVLASVADVRLFKMYADHALQRLMVVDPVQTEAQAAANEQVLARFPVPDVIARQVLIDCARGNLGGARNHLEKLQRYWPVHARDQIAHLRAIADSQPERFPGLQRLISELPAPAAAN